MDSVSSGIIYIIFILVTTLQINDAARTWLAMDLNEQTDSIDSHRKINCEELDHYRQLTDFMLNETQKCFKIIHFNIRSYYKNIDSVLVLLEGLTTDFDCIVLTEAWLELGRPLTQLDNYNIFYTNNSWNRNDGVVVYLKSNFDATVQEIKLGDATGLQLTFDTDNRQYSILATYRSPSMDVLTFLDDLRQYCGNTNNRTVYIYTGDINIDIMESNNSNDKELYLNLLYETGFTEGVNKPTRQTDCSSTCIDHMFIKYSDLSRITAGIFKTDITDHYAIVAKINYCYRQTDTDTDSDSLSTYVDRRMLSSLLETQSWDRVLAHQDVNNSCNEFFDTLDTLKSLSVKKKKKSTRYKKLKPWITSDLVYGIRQRDKMSKKVKMQPLNVELKNQFLEFRSNLSIAIKRTKTYYYKNKILESSGKPKIFWDIINEYNGVNKKNIKFPVHHFSQASDAAGGAVEVVATAFNSFFSQVGNNLARELPPLNGPPVVDDASFATRHEFRLEPVTSSQVESCVREMRGGSAPGYDNFCVSVLKNNVVNLITPLKHIINQSILSGTFPDRFKIARVIPLYKSGTKADFSNYRPISLLSVVSKVLEKCVKLQLQTYLEKYELLAEEQFGFRKGKNTSDALFSINKFLNDSVNKNNKNLIVFIDLAKAFDSIKRCILFSKLEYIGVRGVAQNWFRSYLTGRTQVVSINNQNSNVCAVDYGIVQGSTLGPLLFLIYINNLSKLRITGKLFLFADDTMLIFKGSTWNEVYKTAAQEIALINQWFIDNCLTMNVTKTKCMPIALRSVSEPPADLQLVLHSCGDTNSDTCDCRIVERVDHYKYLGVVLDSKLRWEHHVNYLKSKLRKMIYVFYQLNEILNMAEIKLVYYAYVQSLLKYGIIVWGGALKTIIEPLSVIQKSVIKTAFKKSRQYATDLLFRESGLLSIRQLFIKDLLLFTFTHKEVVVSSTTHSYHTRSAASLGLQVPRVVLSVNYTNSFYIANFLLRTVPPEIRDLEGSSTDKRIITAWLVGAGPDHAESLLRSLYC